jgi:Tol biopolymer transport system component
MRRLRLPVLGAAIAAASIILASQAPPAQAAYPGANGRILFGRFDYPAVGAYDLFTANPDGSHVLQVTHVPSYCTEWSPDGTRIAFTFVEPDGADQIATMAPDGSNVKVLTSRPAISECPSWSPDGTKIVFDFSVGDDPNAPGFATHLSVMNADGTDPHPLMAPSLQGFDVEPRWQPTGHLIAFVRIRKGSLGIQQEAVFVAGVDGTGVRQLTSWGLAPEHPTWSPDGQLITFNDASFKPGAHETIWVMRPDGTDRHVVYQGTANTGGVKPQFSPDGTKILFACVTYGSAFGNGHTGDICTMNANGTGVVDITNTPGADENVPSWGTAPLL